MHELGEQGDCGRQGDSQAAKGQELSRGDPARGGDARVRHGPPTPRASLRGLRDSD